MIKIILKFYVFLPLKAFLRGETKHLWIVTPENVKIDEEYEENLFQFQSEDWPNSAVFPDNLIPDAAFTIFLMFTLTIIFWHFSKQKYFQKKNVKSWHSDHT